MSLLNDALVGQLIVLVFLLFSTLRPLLKKTENSDSFAIFSVIAFSLSILLIFVFGLSFLLIIIFILSFIVVLTNSSALFRVLNKLYSSTPSTGISLILLIEAFVVTSCIILCVFFQPIPVNSSLQKQTLYTGSFSRGFTEKEQIFDTTNLIITEYTPEKSLSNDFCVIFLSSIRTTSRDSALRLSMGTEMGLPFFTGDFYSPDAPITNTAIDRPLNINPTLKPFILHFLPTVTTEQKKAFLSQKELELEILLTLAGQKYSSVIIVTDTDNTEIAKKAQQKYPGFILDTFTQTKNISVENYYKKGIADRALLNPFDTFLSSFNTWEDFYIYREYAKTEQPHLRFARDLVEHTEKILEGR